jgi:hypothetical protein
MLLLESPRMVVEGFLMAWSLQQQMFKTSSSKTTASRKLPLSLLLFDKSPLFSADNGTTEETNSSSSSSISDTTNDFDGFNPFAPGSKILPAKGGFGILSDNERLRPRASLTPGGRISPRQMKMKELIADLLACISDNEAVSHLQHSNEKFLLEQLNNMDALLEPESVFTPNMNREERFDMYQQVMTERIMNARAPVAKKALEALRDFVWSKR